MSKIHSIKTHIHRPLFLYSYMNKRGSLFDWFSNVLKINDVLFWYYENKPYICTGFKTDRHTALRHTAYGRRPAIIRKQFYTILL